MFLHRRGQNLMGDFQKRLVKRSIKGNRILNKRKVLKNEIRFKLHRSAELPLQICNPRKHSLFSLFLIHDDIIVVQLVKIFGSPGDFYSRSPHEAVPARDPVAS